MDKFSVSQEAYHELSQQDSTLPRSYLVKGCQQSLDDEWRSLGLQENALGQSSHLRNCWRLN